MLNYVLDIITDPEVTYSKKSNISSIRRLIIKNKTKQHKKQTQNNKVKPSSNIFSVSYVTKIFQNSYSGEPNNFMMIKFIVTQ